jgi:ABC-type lipoprotein export system ATPase subunit
MEPHAPLLLLRKVSKDYAPVEGGASVPVLREIDLEIHAGQSLAIMGPSGSGKSTLLQIIGTLDRPTSGTVALNGRDLSRLSPDELAAIRHAEIGFVFQAHYLLPQCTVWENVLVPALAVPGGADGVQERATELLRRVGLGDRLHHHPGQLSGGERQRVAVARALINRPRLLLADEPTGSLDFAAAESLAQLLLDLNREEQVTLVVATHSRELAARLGAIRVLREYRLLEFNRPT